MARAVARPANAGVGPDGKPGTPGRHDGRHGRCRFRHAGAGCGRCAAARRALAAPAAPATSLPADIPRDSSGEDQVARQLREAALAEKDPAIRDALWDEYRKVMGIKKK